MRPTSDLMPLDGLLKNLKRHLGLCRVESWQDHAGTHQVLLAAQHESGTEVWRLSLDPASREVRAGSEWFSHFELQPQNQPIRAHRDELVARVPVEPAPPEAIELWGLPGRRDALLVDRLNHLVMFRYRKIGIDTHLLYEEDEIFHGGAVVSPFFRDLRPRDMREHRDPPAAAISRATPAMWGFNAFERNLKLKPGISIPRTGLPASPQEDVLLEFPEPGMHPSGRKDRIARQYQELVAATIRAAFDKAMAPILQSFDPAVYDMLGRGKWTPVAHALYAAPGLEGERRRQAAGLYPALSPFFARDAELGRLVDAGRPYEARLRDVLEGLLHPNLAGGLTVGAVRRLRTLDASIGFKELQSILVAASGMPSEWLPQAKGDWNIFLSKACWFVTELSGMDVDLADVLRPAARGWKEFEGLCLRAAFGQTGEGSVFQSLQGAQDMSRRLFQTLARPLLNARLGEDVQGLDELRASAANPLYRLATRLLFQGKSVFGIAKATDRWHADLDRFELALPREEAVSSWPVLFPPRRADGGLEIVCLGSLAELREEGASGPDRNGALGLDHCVGGYGEQCYAGQSHILSVRRLLPDGGYERLSTVEIGSGGIEDPSVADLEVVQHRGLANTTPPAEAEEAVGLLLWELAHDKVGVDPAALRQRDPEGFSEEYDWRVPENLEKAFEAWAPFLPREIASRGLDGLREHIAVIVGDLHRECGVLAP